MCVLPLVQASQTVVEGLIVQLNQCRKDHQAEVAQLKRLLVAEKQHAQRDIERMKEVSARRCTELAHEEWVLRTQLGTQMYAQQ